MNMQKIKTALIADDDKSHIKTLTKLMDAEGFEVRLAIDTEHALQIIERKVPELIFLSIDTKDYNALEIVERIQHINGMQQPKVIVFTGNYTEDQEVMSFEAGANDFLIKPIRPKAFQKRLSRIRTQFNANQTGKRMLETAHLVLNPLDFSVQYKNKYISLQERTFSLLYTVANSPNQVFTREELLMAVWNDNADVSVRSVDVHVLKIRQKIEKDLIKTVKGIGYKFSD